LRSRSGQRGVLALLAFANPAISKQTADRARLANKEEKIEALPGTEDEAREIGQVYGASQSRVYVGAQAREQAAKEEAGNFRVLHFAAPAALSDISPMYSHIALAQSDAGAKEDGLLEVWEMMSLDLRADLAVLSASETAQGQIGMGEGTMGLAWAVYVAGCPTAVISKWRAGAAEMAVEFHRNQRLATSKAYALRQAAVKLLRGGQHGHPFYWASLCVIGDAT
jgi:CHAT domain-containing protein